MSYLENSNETFPLLVNILNDLQASQQNSLSCDIFNASSLLLKHVNIIILNNSPQSSHSPQSQQQGLDNDTGVDINSTGLRDDYDYSGALVYILFILFWYSMSIIAMIKIQTKKCDLDYFEDSDDSDDNTAHGLLKRIRDDNVKREALEELIKPGFRDKMWDIYSETPNSYKIRKFESKKLQLIDRKLKQYNTQKGEFAKESNYKTIDVSQLERVPRQKVDSTNLFLLRDVNKFEPSANISSLFHQNQNTITSRSSNAHLDLQRPRYTSENFQYQLPAPTAGRFRVEKIKEFET